MKRKLNTLVICDHLNNEGGMCRMVSFYANNISGAKYILIRQNHERSSCHYHLDDKIIFSKIGQKENLSPIEKIFNVFS